MHTKVYLPTYNYQDARFNEEDGISLEFTIKKKENFVFVYYKGGEFYLSVKDLIDLANVLDSLGGL